MNTENQQVTRNEKHSNSTVMLNVNKSRSRNDEIRGKRHLTKDEVLKVCDAVKKGSRYPVRDELMILMCFYHGLRVSELTGIRWQHINLKSNVLQVKRKKGSIDTTHPIFNKRVLMLVRKLHRNQGKPSTGFIFQNERKNPVSNNAFQKMIGKFSSLALGIKWNAHALRHGCGTAMIEAGYPIRKVQNWLGHSNIQNTVKYLHETSRQFDDVEF